MARKAEKLAHKARVACEKWRAYFKYNIDQYHMMHTFVLGQQWTDDEEDMLKTFRKIPLISNKLATMANSLCGEQQQNTPQLEVVPMANCNAEVAKIRELIVKDIMFSTSANTVYQVAASQAFIGGYSAFCVDTDYVHQKAFELNIVYRHFKDATRTYFDIGADRVNKTDGMRCGYITRMTYPKLTEIYGKELSDKISKIHSTVASEEDIALAVQPNEGDDPFTWADNEAVTIIDHFERKYEKDTLYKMSNGKILNQDEMDELVEKSMEHNAETEQSDFDSMLSQGGMPNDEYLTAGTNEYPGKDEKTLEISAQNAEGEAQIAIDMNAKDVDLDFVTLWDEGEIVRIEDKRPSKKHKIMHYKLAGDYILDESEFPSDQLPLIFVDQNSYYDKNGKQICRSFFGDCKDTQRYINYLRTQSAYILKVSRYDQFMGSKKNVAGMDTQRNWRDPAATQGMITYDESPNGHKPEQIRPPELSASLLTQYQLAIEDLYTSTGLYPTRMGQQGNEVSAVAINARTRQGSYSTSIAFNSINRAIATGGEVVNEMIPRVYDSERVIALMTPDEGMKNITINKQADEYGELIENDIRKGTYEVRLNPGPSFEGQKQQALESLQQVLQADPQAFALIADLYAENLPLMNTIEIKNRLKTMVPPPVIEAGKTGKMPEQNAQPSPEEQAMQMQAQNQQQQNAMKAKELEFKQKEIELKEHQIMMETQFKLKELESQRIEIAAKLQEQELRYAAETQRTQSDMQMAHADNLVKLLTHKQPQERIQK